MRMALARSINRHWYDISKSTSVCKHCLWSSSNNQIRAERDAAVGCTNGSRVWIVGGNSQQSLHLPFTIVYNLYNKHNMSSSSSSLHQRRSMLLVALMEDNTLSHLLHLLLSLLIIVNRYYDAYEIATKLCWSSFTTSEAQPGCLLLHEAPIAHTK